MLKNKVTNFLILYLLNLNSFAQFEIKESVLLPELYVKHLILDTSEKNWIISDGYKTYQYSKDFKNKKLLWNSYPKYQYEISKLNKENYFIRNYGFEDLEYGIEIRNRVQDSSTLFIFNEGNMQTTNLPAYSFFKTGLDENGKLIRSFAVNSCNSRSKDSITICTGAVVGLFYFKNGKEVFFKLPISSSVSTLSLTKNAAHLLIGTKDSGWYLIPTKNPEAYINIPAGKDSRITAFFEHPVTGDIWVQEDHYWNGFETLKLFNLKNENPQLVKTITKQMLGFNNNKASFYFNFKEALLFAKSGLINLLIYDLQNLKIKTDLFSELSNLGISKLSNLYYCEESSLLYVAAQKHAANLKLETQLLTIGKSGTPEIPIVKIKNRIPDNYLYDGEVRVVVNETPQFSYSNKSDAFIASNGLALFPINNFEFMLYNINNGRMIFTGNSLLVRKNPLYASSNKIVLSPNGKYLLEYMVKGGITYGISDTLKTNLINIETGLNHEYDTLLAAENNTELRHVSWNKNDQPLFTITNKKENKIEINNFLLAENLAFKPENQNHFPYNEVLYNVYSLNSGKNFLTVSGNLYETGKRKTYRLFIPDQPVKEIAILDDEGNLEFNEKSFLLITEKDSLQLFKYYTNNGDLINQGYYNQKQNYSTPLLYFKPYKYLSSRKDNSLTQLNLETNVLTKININNFKALNVSVSANDKYFIEFADEFKTWTKIENELFKLYEVKKFKNYINNTQLTGKYLVSNGRVWNLNTAVLESSTLQDIIFTNDSSSLETCTASDLVDDLGYDENFNRQYKFRAHSNNFIKDKITENKIGEWLNNTSYTKKYLVTKNYQSGKIINYYDLPFESSSYFEKINLYPYKNNYALVVKKDGNTFNENIIPDSIAILNLSTGKYSKIISGNILQMKLDNASDEYILFIKNSKTKKLECFISTQGNWKEKTVKGNYLDNNALNFCIIDDANIAFLEENKLGFLNFNTNQKNEIPFRYYPTRYYDAYFLTYDAVEKAIYILYNNGDMIKFMDGKIAETNQIFKNADGFAGSNQNQLLVIDKSGNYHFVNKKSLQTELQLFTWEGKHFTDRTYMWLTKENYYMASAGAENNIHFAKKSNLLSLKQMDVKYNRPAQVLNVLNAPKNEIEFYRQLENIRQQKYGNLKNQTKWNVDLSVSPVSIGQEVVLNLKAKSKEPIVKVGIIINGCPYPVPLLKSIDKEINENISIPLNAGSNTIYVWVENKQEQISNLEEIKVEGNFKDNGKWYFAGVAVSAYKNQNKNLRYADKDIRDIAKFLSKQYPGIIIDTLLNEKVTIENLEKMNQRLKSTRADDKVFVAFSGHGLLDEQKQFWFATHDMDFKNPKDRGWSMASITNMLQFIPARYRMITLDACQSGDVIYTQGEKSANNTETLPVVEGSRGNELLGKGLKPSSSTLLKALQSIFTDQLSNTGINLIAASSGAELAQESNKWGNGAFTYALLKGWEGAAKEQSHLPQIHYSGLKKYIQNTVLKITNGLQTPNTVMENGEINWWLIAPR